MARRAARRSERSRPGCRGERAVAAAVGRGGPGRARWLEAPAGPASAPLLCELAAPAVTLTGLVCTGRRRPAGRSLPWAARGPEGDLPLSGACRWRRRRGAAARACSRAGSAR